MATKPWKRFFGLQENRWAGRDPDRRPLPDDCNTVVTPSAYREAGVTNVPRARRSVERDGRFHHHDVILPDGRKVQATHQTSFNWIVGVLHEENRERSRANLRVGSQAPPIETIVTKPQGSGAAFVPEVWRVPIAPPAPRTDATLPEACRRSSLERPATKADRAVAVVPRNDDPELLKEMINQLHDDARLLLTTTGPLDLAAIAAALRLSSGEDRVALAKALRNTDGAIIGAPEGREGRRFLYRVARPATHS